MNKEQSNEQELQQKLRLNGFKPNYRRIQHLIYEEFSNIIGPQELREILLLLLLLFV